MGTFPDIFVKILKYQTIPVAIGSTAYSAIPTDFRFSLQTVNLQGEQYKILPILSWSSKDI